MPSINDVFDQLKLANQNLDLIHGDGIAETSATSQVKASVDKVDSDVKAGLDATVTAVQTLDNDVNAGLNATATALQTLDNDVKAGLNATATALQTLDNDVKAGLNATVTALQTLDNDVKGGSTATVQALNVLSKINIEAVKLLFHLTQQVDTMICCLEHISKNTCQSLNPPMGPPPRCVYEPCPAPQPATMPVLPTI